ncbi:MAG: alpha/beta hydrolase [Nocardioides sp.]|jgi:3-oxoadipate enol-lactonase
MSLLSPRGLLKQVYLPYAPIPDGRMVTLPGRGTTYVTDTPGPTPDAPALLLLHALGCTGLLTWYPSIPTLIKRYRVITLDQRMHGQGICDQGFSLRAAADDAVALLDVLEIDQAIVAGYSMGSIITQRVWRQHPSRVRGLILAASTDRFRRSITEHAFFASMSTAILGAKVVSRSPAATEMARNSAEALDLVDHDIHDWAMQQVRSTSPYGIAQALAGLGKHHSVPWLRQIDVPTAVVINNQDRVIPTGRQYVLARRIPGATIHDLDAGHASCVMQSERFVPVFVEAVHSVNARANARGAS